ncbi:hypothetical protein BDZ89DRAFT_1126742 [Hymenopellis radicata]|nr:hypothetical protein BDZ89DRAFT_1126742 [Hymenopellis radicata]
MDNRTNAPANPPMHELFSRGPTPPVQQPQPQYVSPPHLSHNMSSNQIDSLFQHLNPSSSSDLSQSQQSTTSYGSGPATPIIDEQPVSSPPTNPTSQSITERQNALLSMLTGPPNNQSGRPAAAQTQQQQQQQQPQQIPTPPGSSQRSNASPPTNAELQGKILLDQLMSGCVKSLSLRVPAQCAHVVSTCASGVFPFSLFSAINR